MTIGHFRRFDHGSNGGNLSTCLLWRVWSPTQGLQLPGVFFQPAPSRNEQRGARSLPEKPIVPFKGPKPGGLLGRFFCQTEYLAAGFRERIPGHRKQVAPSGVGFCDCNANRTTWVHPNVTPNRWMTNVNPKYRSRSFDHGIFVFWIVERATWKTSMSARCRGLGHGSFRGWLHPVAADGAWSFPFELDVLFSFQGALDMDLRITI